MLVFSRISFFGLLTLRISTLTLDGFRGLCFDGAVFSHFFFVPFPPGFLFSIARSTALPTPTPPFPNGESLCSVRASSVFRSDQPCPFHLLPCLHGLSEERGMLVRHSLLFLFRFCPVYSRRRTRYPDVLAADLPSPA